MSSETLVKYPDALVEVIDSFSDLNLPDLTPLLVTFGSIAGSRFEGRPIHLMLIGPSSCGKNTIMESCFKLPNTQHISTFSEASLLSGTSKKERTRDATGGYLRQLGEKDGLIILTEFNSILTMPLDKRTNALGALQNVCTGLIDRGNGADGGSNLHWRGKIQVIAGCTENIEESRSLLNKIGERFLYYRFPQIDRKGHVQAALRNSRNGQASRFEARRLEVVTAFFERLVLPECAGSLVNEADEEIVGAIADFTTLARSAVVRDDRSREVIQVYEGEAPGRVTNSLYRLLCGLRAIGVPNEESILCVVKVALSSVPMLRRAIIRIVAAGGGDPVTTSQIREQITNFKEAVIRRALEDLEIHGIVQKFSGHENYWTFTASAMENWYIGFGGLE